MTRESQQTIFLSHSSEDRGIAREIYRILRDSGINVWYDEAELRVGERWDLALERAMARANVMLLLVGSRAGQEVFSRWRSSPHSTGPVATRIL